MAIAAIVKDYLEKTGTRYSMVPHPHTWSSSDTAKAAHVPPERIAKAVILADQAGYVVAVVPANRHVDLEALSKEFGRDLALAPEFRIGSVFKDCGLGAIPPLGPAYEMTMMLDNCLIGTGGNADLHRGLKSRGIKFFTKLHRRAAIPYSRK
jgi:Ala-tRNA(Pro) deacylase